MSIRKMGEGLILCTGFYNPHPHSYGYSSTTATSPQERCCYADLLFYCRSLLLYMSSNDVKNLSPPNLPHQGGINENISRALLCTLLAAPARGKCPEGKGIQDVGQVCPTYRLIVFHSIFCSTRFLWTIITSLGSI